MRPRLRQDVAPGIASIRHVCGLLLCVGLWTGCQQEAPTSPASEPTPVTVSLPIEKQVADYADFSGRTKAVELVDIRARVTGYLNKVCFEDGAEVKKGDILFEIDPRPFQAKYDQTLAKIRLCEADLKYRKAELARTSKLLTTSAVSQSDYDQSVAAHDQTIAALAAAEAAAEEAKLNLGYTKLHSPIDGEVGRALITKGNLVNADQTLLTTVVSVDPIYVYFDVDEQTILEVRDDVRSGRIKVREKEEVPVQMGLMNEKGFPHHGYVDFMDNQLNPNTGTVTLRGLFPNPQPSVGGRILKPGNFARIRVVSGEPQRALLIAERAMAVGSDQGQRYLLVVDDKNVVQYRPITPGKSEGSLLVIEKGLKPTDRVIVGGLQRVQPGMTVAPKLIDMTTFVEQDDSGLKSPNGKN